MTTTCERIEALLPALVEGSLGPGDAAVVSAHVESCSGCQESLAAFTVLEQSLVARRSEVPPVESFLPAFIFAAAPAHAHPRLLRVFRTMMSLPGVSIVLTMWAAMLVFSFRADLGENLSRYSSLERWQALFGGVTHFLVGALGNNLWTMTVAYVALTLLILGSMGAMTYRFVRR